MKVCPHCLVRFINASSSTYAVRRLNQHNTPEICDHCPQEAQFELIAL